MAKKLIHKYTFNPANDQVTIKYIYKPERLLLISNITRGVLIYAFNEETLKFNTITYDYTNEEMTITLAYDCSAMSSTDKLQIFVEEDSMNFEPSETFVDPVSKIRVSQPENLIDTDFEYGLQSTKWETLELVKNIPTFFSRSGDNELLLSDIAVVNNSDTVTVTLTQDHNFLSGSPLIVSGTDSITCDGTFVVTSILSSTVFQYKAKAIQNFTGSIKSDYTQLFPGQVYQGTEFDLTGIEAITTDALSTSTLTVKTAFPTGFIPGTSFYLTNSVAQVNSLIDSTQVEAENYEAIQKTTTNDTATGENGFALGAVQPYKYTALEAVYFTNTEVTINASTGIESITFPFNHGITDNTPWLYVAGEGNGVIGGLANYTGYYVRVISPNAIYLTTTLSGTTRVNLTAAGADGGVMRSAFLRGYRMVSANTSSSTESINFSQAHGLTSNANIPVLFFNGTASNYAVSTSLLSPSTVYYPRVVASATTSQFTTSVGGGLIGLSSTTANAIMIKIVALTDANTIFFQEHGLSTDNLVTFTVLSGTIPTGLTNNVTYKVERVSGDRIRFKNNDTGATISLTSAGSTTAQFQITSKIPILENDSIFSANHGIQDGGAVIYDNNGNSDIPGLVDNTTYYAFQRTNDRFKLTTTNGGWLGTEKSFNQSTAVNLTTNVITTGTHGFTSGDAVQYLSASPLGGLNNGAWYWARAVSATTCTLHWTKSGATGNTDLVDIGTPNTGTGSLRNASLVDITAAGTGTHIFKSTGNSASDGVYFVNGVIDDNTFSLASNNQIPQRELPIVPDSDIDLSRSAINYSNHSISDATTIRYTTTGSAIGGLVNDTDYYVIRISRNWFKLAASQADARNGTAITLTSLGSGTHLLKTAAVSGEVLGPGTIDIPVDSSRVTGTNTNFSALFSPGDNLIIYTSDATVNKTVSSINTTTNVLTSTAHGLSDGDPVKMSAASAPGGTTNGYIYYIRSTGTTTPANEFTLHPTYDDAINDTNVVDITSAGTTVVAQYISGIGSTDTKIIKYVNSSTDIILQSDVSVAFTGSVYAVSTALLVRADGFALHRPYDGGVELIPSTNPDSTMIRQTRKYFRYQSGKGIQVSFAVNFSPSTILDTLSVSFDQSKVDKCERDIGYFIDGCGFDITLGTNYNAIFLGIAETNSLFISPLVIDTIERARDEILDLAAVTGEAATRATAYWAEILDITENGRDAANALTFTNPAGGSSTAIAAKDKLLANIDFMIAEVNAYVEATYGPTDHDVSKCSRDLKYAIWGFAYDILYGGNSATYDSAKFFLYYKYDGNFGIEASHITQTVGAYTRLKAIIGDIVQGIAVTPTTGNTETQVTSGDNAGATEATALGTLADIIIDTIDDQAVPVGVTKTTPSVAWSDSALQTAKSSIDSNKSAIIAVAVNSDIGFSTATATTRYPHRLSKGVQITISGANNDGGANNYWNGVFGITEILDPYRFTVALNGAPSVLVAAGLIEYHVNNWSNSRLKCGLFDDQNGLFFEYDGQQLNCVRRSSTLQISGTASVTFKSGSIIGTNTKFSSQVAVGDKIVIKGQTYLVTKISSDTLLYILPSYRGISNENVILTKTVDTKVPQSNWNVDPLDGTGPTGFVLDVNKIQMAYMDYSWYGAGKVRFGFKNQEGKVIYAHEFLHNNKFTEAYMRSGNLPARYEIENSGAPTYVPALAHWGTSVIMDGRFDDDKAYVFTAGSNTLSITGSATLTVSARVETTARFQVLQNNQWRDAGYALTVATPNPSFAAIPSGAVISGAGLPVTTFTTLPQDSRINPRQPYLPSVDSRYNFFNQAARTLLIVNRQPTGTAGTASNYTVTLSSAATPVVYEQPLISIRLAPSVDTGTPGALGQREIINRMQLILNAVGILSTHSAEIYLKLNGSLNNNSWQRVSNPSLSQLIYHDTSDTISGGTIVYSFRSQGGTGTTARAPVITTADLGDIATLGNSILGGDNIFPDGPDVLTVVAKLVEDPSTVSSTNPFSITARISWSESQA